MLQLKNITKNYETGASIVPALKGVSIDFRENEFVSILGQSGCGKTTLLNIIGGLDRYTDGDLIINGKSTKDFTDHDWDTYRNHSIGFVFQSYNLIPHQTVLANVELALTLSGIPQSERKARAVAALEEVGLGDQLHKKPNQMSGGQMQRVAIARAIVNNPDILLADEPTGALDSATSVQVMELLKKIARNKLVIMVTHNPQLAEQYSTRIVRLLDGRVVDDSDPFRAEEDSPLSGKQPETGKAESVSTAKTTSLENGTAGPKGKKARKPKKDKGPRTSMSFRTALSLSLNNLMTKKGRTAMTVFAGSIGIIGIALILAMSSGLNGYIEAVQKDTLSSYPIEINRQSMDMTSVMMDMMANGHKKADTENRDPNRVYANNILTSMLDTMSSGIAANDLKKFKEFVQSNEVLQNRDIVSAIQYTYNLKMNIFKEDTSEGVIQVNPSRVMQILMSTIGLGATDEETASAISEMYGMEVWTEMLDNPELLDAQYELLDQKTMHWPRNYDEIVIVVNEYNELSDIAVFSLGLRNISELESMLEQLKNGGSYDFPESDYSFDDLMNLTYRVVLPSDCYVFDPDAGIYTDKSKDSAFMKGQIADGIQLKVVGIVRPRSDAVSGSISGTIGYTKGLTEYVIREINESDLVRRQLADRDTDVLTGLPFNKGQFNHLTSKEKEQLFRDYAAGSMPVSKKSRIILSMMQNMTMEEREKLLSSLSEEERKALTGEDFSKLTDVELSSYISMKIEHHPKLYEEFQMKLMASESFRRYILSTFPEDKQEQFESIIMNLTAEEMLTLWKQQAPTDQTPEEKLQMMSRMLMILSHEDRMYFAESISENEVLAKLESMEGSMDQMAIIFDRALTYMSEPEVAMMFDAYMPPLVSGDTYETVMKKLGQVDLDDPSSIALYVAGFEEKDQVLSVINQYNEDAKAAGKDGQAVQYNDYVGVMMSFFTNVVNVISYVLIAFVSVSLVVSSIMIGIITYISVLERTKEIGILRAMGASKRDISHVFNAETIIIGFSAGLCGILITVLLCFPINAIIRHATGISTLTAALPWLGAVILVAISTLLTVIAGLIPSFSAAKKDPVIALRSE